MGIELLFLNILSWPEFLCLALFLVSWFTFSFYTLFPVCSMFLFFVFGFINSFPEGLEDVSKFPALIQELLKRNWTDDELADVLRRNFLRVFEEVERVS